MPTEFMCRVEPFHTQNGVYCKQVIRQMSVFMLEGTNFGATAVNELICCASYSHLWEVDVCSIKPASNYLSMKGSEKVITY